ncbi:Dam family site-specific DNA-(adenine-N6)-methyltransferase [Mesobacillus maritimus]|uniref:Dam family site-specific DNA-(adenine-N6)-methyltransferase n=1 Tax=Mesobacillus maritimus TaxID=1643336 RepID=UPI00203C748C|nr:Dam family site-specific DNA-(adenine-N6)-methyltransferase [Mesobacillus maritimus]MCM3585015.1 Dam family site-specific DNA-(adenine-N6)-methyltransferase [Mesobacillus maritimus]
MKSTKEIEKEYKVTRQTLHNWINEGLISTPRKDWRGWFEWDNRNELEIKDLMKVKEDLYNPSVQEIPAEKLKIFNRRYLGSKQKMLDFIYNTVVNNTTGIYTVADIFGGTGSVAEIFRSKGKRIIINDILHSNFISYLTWFGSDEVDYSKIKKYINELNSLESKEDNYVSLNFGDKYFSMENARKIGVIRERIEEYTDLNEREKAFLITSLIYAMDKVANTVGHYDAYRHKMDSLKPIQLRVPELYHNLDNEIYCDDANELVRRIKADLVYIDTPYNSRQYGDAYHLLENIVDWNKPDLTGIAMKMVNRQHIKSDYSTKKAPTVFDDLIQHIDAKYILVSYNNMAKKGDGRSNAKISNEEIITSLEKRGEVTIFETPFQTFTTGKTNIEDHKELLYLCKIHSIKRKTGNIKKTVLKNNYIKSAINYTGGKHKLLPQLHPLFPKDYENFIDIFSGGANVGINANPKEKIYLNDTESHIIELYKLLSTTAYDEVIYKVNDLIYRYKLSNTKKFGYEFYGLNSADGLGKYNKEGFLKLRNDYNKGVYDNDKLKPIVFYVLIVYAFNNQVRFNSKGEYNLPVGKRDFNVNMEKKLHDFHKALQEKDFVFSSKDFREFTQIGENDFVYLDPPYLISTASYNENGGWTEKDELELLGFLDELNKKGIRWALSNVSLHKGKENTLLLNWSEKYDTHTLDYHYNNSNYQSTAKNNITQEVLITNYKID